MKLMGSPWDRKDKIFGHTTFALLKMKYRVLVCAPTNIAIKEVASRVVTLVKESHAKESGDLFCSMGDLLLSGNNERLKIGEDIKDIYLDHLAQQLAECLAPSTGLSSCLKSMIGFLENCTSYYHIVKDEYELGKRKSK